MLLISVMHLRLWSIVAGLGLSVMACSTPSSEPRGTRGSMSSGTVLDKVLTMGEAQQTISGFNDQLDAELARVGPGLTTSQQTAYVAQFALDVSPDVKAAQDKYRIAADAVALQAQERLPEVLAFARNQAPASSNGEELYSDYLILARTDHAAEAIRFMNSLAHDPSFAKLMAIDPSFYDADRPKPEDVVATAVPYVVAKGLADHETPDAVVTGLSTLLSTSLGDNSITLYDAGFAAIDITRALQLRGHDHLAALLPLDKIDKISDRAVAKAITGLGTAFALWSAKDSLQDGDLGGFLQSTAGAASDTLVIVGGLAESVHAFRPFAETLVDVGEKIGPGIDLVLAAVSTAQDVQAVLANSDPALKARLFGDALSTLGAIIVFVNPEIGAVVVGIGTAVAVVAGIIADQNAQNAADSAVAARTSKVLQKGSPSLDAASAARVADALVKAQDDHLWDMSEYPMMSSANPKTWYDRRRLGLTAAQIQLIANRAPNFVIEGSHTDNAVDGLQSFEAKCLIASMSYADLQHGRDRLYGALDAALTASGEVGVRILATSMNHAYIMIPDCAGWTAYLKEVAANGDDDLKKAAVAVQNYVASH